MIAVAAPLRRLTAAPNAREVILRDHNDALEVIQVQKPRTGREHNAEAPFAQVATLGDV
eukprot:CAMPEP_0114122908 /NCGR_PEP_ID=MMETSP0043_2-20121206/7943_1 /TAXON_ID=464988 /ORGANISM="Hemiselmis andersenii, Strain CCMP644" /LENGTH=58 /DNA_ID=CAMNT_0001215649 /DNA_START=187 /DNA_END=363 /DNA_ORIENTATION=-